MSIYVPVINLESEMWGSSDPLLSKLGVYLLDLGVFRFCFYFVLLKILQDLRVFYY